MFVFDMSKMTNGYDISSQNTKHISSIETSFNLKSIGLKAMILQHNLR